MSSMAHPSATADACAKSSQSRFCDFAYPFPKLEGMQKESRGEKRRKKDRTCVNQELSNLHRSCPQLFYSQLHFCQGWSVSLVDVNLFLFFFKLHINDSPNNITLLSANFTIFNYCQPAKVIDYLFFHMDNVEPSFLHDFLNVSGMTRISLAVYRFRRCVLCRFWDQVHALRVVSLSRSACSISGGSTKKQQFCWRRAHWPCNATMLPSGEWPVTQWFDIVQDETWTSERQSSLNELHVLCPSFIEARVSRIWFLTPWCWTTCLD